MATRNFSFPALRVHQGAGAPPLILLSASAVHLEQFAGIPQKRRLEEGETIGFQRDADDGRVDALAKFYGDPRNVIHNPLLCALRVVADGRVEFITDAAGHAEADDGQAGDGAESPPAIVVAEIADASDASDAPGSVVDGDAASDASTDAGELAAPASTPGRLEISFPDYSDMPLGELFRLAREALEARVPEMKGREDPSALVAKLAAAAELAGVGLDVSDAAEASDEVDPQGDTSGENGAGEEALFEESHVGEFWAALRARELLLVKQGPNYAPQDFLGFTREALEAYLRPVVLVDGQHRLLGAMRAARNALNAEGSRIMAIGEQIRAGAAPDEVEERLLVEHARRLPISLLMDSRPEEHVFQFVVVNQKATPVRAALLATIISTSLSQQELDPITERLENAGIPLRSSRAITYLASNAASPFAGLVARGLADEGSELLPWTVLGQLVNIFRDLKGGRFFHERKDYADIWRRRLLESSPIAQSAADSEIGMYESWRQPDGPWRDVFIAFWTSVRDELGNTTNPEVGNYWGRPRSSNLFNKPSLLTLAADFFAFLVESRQSIQDTAAISDLVNDWLLDVDRNYFARDWRLTNVKKDSTGTRKQWARIWQEYRIDPKALPNVTKYSVNYKEG